MKKKTAIIKKMTEKTNRTIPPCMIEGGFEEWAATHHMFSQI